VAVSDAGFTGLAGQVADAVQFLARHEAELTVLVKHPDVESLTLDFGIRRRDVAVQNDTFPASLLRRCGELGIDLMVSAYEIADDQ